MARKCSRINIKDKQSIFVLHCFYKLMIENIRNYLRHGCVSNGNQAKRKMKKIKCLNGECASAFNIQR